MGKDIHTDSPHFTVTVTTVGGIFAWGSYTVLQNSVLSCVTVFFWFRHYNNVFICINNISRVDFSPAWANFPRFPLLKQYFKDRIPYQINWQYTDQVKRFPLLYIIHIVGHDYHYEISIKSQTRLFSKPVVLKLSVCLCVGVIVCSVTIIQTHKVKRKTTRLNPSCVVVLVCFIIASANFSFLTSQTEKYPLRKHASSSNLCHIIRHRRICNMCVQYSTLSHTLSHR